MVRVRPTNGVSFGAKHTIVAADVNTPAVAEVVTLIATGAPDADGNVTVALPSLTGVDIAVIGVDVAEVVELEVTGTASASGDIGITLPSLAEVTVAILDTDDLAGIATKIRAATFTGWTTGGSGAVVTFTNDTAGDVSGTPAFGAGTTGSTATISVTTEGVTSDTTTDIATKIRAGTFTGWTTGGTGTTVTFTKNVAGAVSGTPSFTDTESTGSTATITVTTEGADEIDNLVDFDFRIGDTFRYPLVAIVNCYNSGVLTNPVDLSVSYPSDGVIRVNGTLVLGHDIEVLAQRDSLN